MSEVYLVKSRHRHESRYHLDKECPYLEQNEHGIITRERGPLDDWGYECCQQCDPDSPNPGGKHDEMRPSLRRMIQRGDIDVD